MSFLRQCGAFLARRSNSLIYRLAAVTGSRRCHWPIFDCARVVQTKRNAKLYQLMLGGSAILIAAAMIDWEKCGSALAAPKLYADDGSSTANLEVLRTKRRKGSIAAKAEKLKKKSAVADSNAPEKKSKRKRRLGFRARKIIEYENRMRQYSSPDKVFRYFATVRQIAPNGTTEIYMTPQDFLRAMYPGSQQPEGLGLDKYRRKASADWNKNLEKWSIFYELGSDGLITFADYIFLLTVLNASPRHFEIAFQMFDLEGKGYVDTDEFIKVAKLARVTSRVGVRQRDSQKVTKTPYKSISPGLIKYFFRDKKLTVKAFLVFKRRLTSELLSLEFDRHRLNAKGNISEVDFADLLLTYAGYSESRMNDKLKHVKLQYGGKGPGISRQDYSDFFFFLTNISDVATALTFYRMVGAPIDQWTLKHAAKAVVGLKLSDHLCEVVFTIFDDNNDNQLSNREFVAVMKKRMNRGMDVPKDMGFIKLLRSIFKCTRESCNRHFHKRYLQQ